jgi:hypothetical protein
MAAFPRESIAWHLERVTTLRRLSLSLSFYGVVVGVLARTYRWVALTVIAPTGLAGILGSISVGVVLICGLAALHLANFTLKSWRWRAPALGAVIGVGEMATSLGLTALGQERLGRAVATFADWPGSAVSVVISRTVVVTLFAAVLAAVVVALRRAGVEPAGE